MKPCFKNKIDNPLRGDKLPCFFCFRDSRKILNSFETYFWGSSEKSFGEFSLRNLYRFLNLLQHEEEEKNLKDLKMPICEECSKLTSEFNKLYSLLEETKLRLNWCVQKMKDVMEKCTDENESKILNKVQDDEDIIRIMRTDTINRMNSIAQLPRVVIRRIKRDMPSSFAGQNPCRERNGKRAKIRKEDDLNLKIIDTIGNAMDMTNPFPVRPLPQLFGHDGDNKYGDDLSHNSENNELAIKVECDVEITESQDDLHISSTSENIIFGRHIKSENGLPVPLSSNVQMPRIKKTNFYAKMKGAYMSNFVTDSHSNQNKVRCLLCSKTLSRAKAHAHWSHYCVKGMRRPISSTSKTENGNDSSSSSSKCSYCPFEGMRDSMKKHQLRFHPEHYFPEEREIASGLKLSLEQFRRILLDFLFPDFITEGEGPLMSCSTCGMKYNSQNRNENKMMVQKHLLSCHKTELKERLNTIMEDPFLAEGLQSNSEDHGQLVSMAMESTGFDLEVEGEEISPPNDMEIDFQEEAIEIEEEESQPSASIVIDSSNKCTYCPYVCGAASSGILKVLGKHHVRFHPEHYFPEEWDSAEAGLTLEQFQRLLWCILLPEFIVNATNFRSCSICGMRYTGTMGSLIEVQWHLVRRHKCELRKRLKLLLRDPVLEERINSCNPKRRRRRRGKIEKGKAGARLATKTVTKKERERVVLIPTTKYSAKCPHCGYKCGAVRTKHVRDSMKKHLVRFHPEHFLKTEGGGELSRVDRQRCREILTDVIFPQSILNGGGRYPSCSLCGLKYRSNIVSVNMVTLKTHILFQHKSHVEEQINMILEVGSNQKVGESNDNESSEELPLPSGSGIREDEEKQSESGYMSHFTPVFSDKTKVCCICKKYVSRKNASTHWKYYCLNKGSTPSRRPIVSNGDVQGNNPLKCSYCPVVCGAGRGLKNSMTRHQVRFHPEHYFPEEREKASVKGLKLEEFQKIIKKNLFGEFISKGGSHTSCLLCGMKYKSKFGSDMNAEKHLIFSHRDQLNERLNEILDDSILEERLPSLERKEKKQFSKSATATTTTTTQKHSTAILSNNYSNCPYCPYKCNSVRKKARRDSLLSHLVRFHPEHFLIEKGDDDKADQNQIRGILTEIIFPKFVLATGNHTSCALCGLKYSKSSHFSNNTVMAKRHVLFSHKQDVKEEIKIILGDPILEEMLEKCQAEPEPQPQPQTSTSLSLTVNKTKAVKVETTTKTPLISPKKSSHCPYCPYKCNATKDKGRRNSVVCHLIRFHPEHFLIDKAKGDDVPELEKIQVRKILTDIIFPKFVQSSGNHTSCTLCGERYDKSNHFSNNTVTAKRHVLSRHKLKVKEDIRVIMEKRLQKSQTAPPVDMDKPVKIFRNVKITANGKCKRAPDGTQYSSNCPYCRFKCGATSNSSTRDSMVKHFVRFHPEHFLVKEGNGGALSDQEKKKYREILTDVIFPKFISSKGRYPSCNLCGGNWKSLSVCNNILLAKKHVLLVHQKEVKRQLPTILGHPMSAEHGNKVIAATSSAPATKKRFHVQPTLKKKMNKPGPLPRFTSNNCPYCRFRCGTGNGSSRTSMLRHLARFHPEHFLREDEGSNEIPMPGLRHPQFQRILTDIVFPEFITSRGHHTKCSVCDKKFAGAKLYENTMFARKHVMYRHKTELKMRLKSVLEDPMLEETLDSCNLSGVTCSCGVYFAQPDTSAQTNHVKFHCVNSHNSSEKVEENVQFTAAKATEIGIEEEECLMEVSEFNGGTDSFHASDDVDPLG